MIARIHAPSGSPRTGPGRPVREGGTWWRVPGRSLLLLVALAPVLAPAAAAQSAVVRLLEQAVIWRGWSEGKEGPSDGKVRRFVERLQEQEVDEATEERLWRLAVLCTSLGDDRRALPHPARIRLDRAGRELANRFAASSEGTRFRSWVLTSLIVAPPDRGRLAPDLLEREAAVELLMGLGVPEVRTALLAAARDADDPFQESAVDALADWAARFGQDDAVDRCLVQHLATTDPHDALRHPMTLLMRRIEGCPAPLGPRASELLEERLRIMLIQSDWRQPARALRLLDGLPVEARIGVLLDGLVVWDRRAREEREYAGLARVRSDLVASLQRVSGKFFGPEPGPWIEWWVRVRQGEELRPGSEAFEAERKRRLEQPTSTVGFFGLRPDSDRVTFVIDRSGSMQTPWGTTERSRYEEAVEQLVRFLQAAPPGTRFNVVLFNDQPLVSGDELVEATAANIQRARASLLGRKPGGGTNLQRAIRSVVPFDGSGFPDVSRLEADTIIVLCDGATGSGRRWVRPFLDRVLPYHPVRFHSVVIGSDGDGALEDLASFSGGRLSTVGG